MQFKKIKRNRSLTRSVMSAIHIFTFLSLSSLSIAFAEGEGGMNGNQINVQSVPGCSDAWAPKPVPGPTDLKPVSLKPVYSSLEGGPLYAESPTFDLQEGDFFIISDSESSEVWEFQLGQFHSYQDLETGRISYFPINKKNGQFDLPLREGFYNPGRIYLPTKPSDNGIHFGDRVESRFSEESNRKVSGNVLLVFQGELTFVKWDTLDGVSLGNHSYYEARHGSTFLNHY